MDIELLTVSVGLGVLVGFSLVMSGFDIWSFIDWIRRYFDGD